MAMTLPSFRTWASLSSGNARCAASWARVSRYSLGVCLGSISIRSSPCYASPRALSRPSLRSTTWIFRRRFGMAGTSDGRASFASLRMAGPRMAGPKANTPIGYTGVLPHNKPQQQRGDASRLPPCRQQVFSSCNCHPGHSHRMILPRSSRHCCSAGAACTHGALCSRYRRSRRSLWVRSWLKLSWYVVFENNRHPPEHVPS